MSPDMRVSQKVSYALGLPLSCEVSVDVSRNEDAPANDMQAEYKEGGCEEHHGSCSHPCRIGALSVPATGIAQEQNDVDERDVSGWACDRRTEDA